MADESNVIPIPVSRGRKVGKLSLYSDADLATAASRDYLVKGLLCPAELSAVYGTPGCGKSFLALHFGRGISRGIPAMFGCRVHQNNVLFLALEGAGGFENRLRGEVLVKKMSSKPLN